MASRYSTFTYRRAITCACEMAFSMPAELRRKPPRFETAEARGLRQQRAREWRKNNVWAPNQLRHTAATELRRRFGLEVARVVLGHSEVDTTEIYAERDFAAARAAMREIG